MLRNIPQAPIFKFAKRILTRTYKDPDPNMSVAPLTATNVTTYFAQTATPYNVDLISSPSAILGSATAPVTQIWIRRYYVNVTNQTSVSTQAFRNSNPAASIQYNNSILESNTRTIKVNY
jgi:hypothetical protein